MASSISGFNPLRWKCAENGCFNEKKRAKIEIFAECFPGRIAMTDIDATVEINGKFLFLEFKDGESFAVPTGQRIYFERLTSLSKAITVIIVHIDIQTMATRAIKVIRKGKVGEWEVTTTEALRQRIRTWSERALDK